MSRRDHIFHVEPTGETALPFLLASGELLAFGSAKTWQEGFHLPSSVPCPAHTIIITSAALRRPACGFCARS